MRERHGATVTWLPFDLHPEIPDEGIDGDRLRGDAERRRAFRDQIARLAAEAGLPWGPAERVPRTRQALEAAEWARQNQPDTFPSLHRRLMHAYWADGRDIGRRDVVLEVAVESGLDGDAVANALQSGAASEDVDASTRAAVDAGVTGTPAWLIAGRFLVPGAQPRETFDRIIDRMRSRGTLT